MTNIVLENISKIFGRVIALKDVNLTINKGEYVTILGPSGCGKTTLLNVISGIINPTTGKVYFDGVEVTDYSIEERKLSFVFQNIALFPHLTVFKNAGYSPRVRGLSEQEIKETASKALELVQALDIQDEYPDKLPNGFQQKVSIARAIATNAPLMILDEPISALDPEVRVNLRYKIREIVKELGLTAIHVTHDQDIAMSVSDRIILMKKGSIIRYASPEQMYAFPIRIFEAFFVGQGNFLEGYLYNQSEEKITIRLRREKDIVIKKQLYFQKFSSGQAIVLFSRPENTLVSKTPLDNSLGGKIKSRVFMGPYY
ncbi:MAG: ABC transporter ATP-binding protein, partial [Candidatus Thorarchaeota archaeon]